MDDHNSPSHGHARNAGGLHVELDYDLSDIQPGPYNPDVEFCFKRMSEELTLAAWRDEPGRVLDVGCGTGKELRPFIEAGWEAWGVEPSLYMIRLADSDLGAVRRQASIVRGIGEALPFPDGYFDRVICKGAIDHFADTAAFAREAARVLAPDGRLVIVFSNFRSLSFRLGKWLYPVHSRLRPQIKEIRPYWMPHDDHTFIGDYERALTLAAPSLELQSVGAASMMWLFPRWGRLLSRLPESASGTVLRGLDQAARRAPRLADVLITVWRPAPRASAGD
jgi:SAM-dependent methyltransferase